MPATLPQSIKGKRSHHHHTCTTCCVEKMVRMRFPLLLFFSFQIFLSIYLLLNCYLVGHAGHPPSVYQGNKSSPPPSLCCLLHGEGSDGEFSSCFCFFPTVQLFFLTASFSSSIVVQLWSLFAVFPIHSSSFISILRCLMFQLKIACQNL